MYNSAIFLKEGVVDKLHVSDLTKQDTYSNRLSPNLIEDGLLLIREQDENGQVRHQSNVPHTAFSGSLGYSWGYGGSGPRELAVNILNSFVPPASDGLTPHELQQTYWPPKKRTFVLKQQQF